VKVLRTLICVSGGVVLAGLLGCSGQPAPPQTVYVPQPQAAVQPQPVAQPQPVVETQYVIVREAPPAIIVENRPPPPGQGHIWIDGYWNWNGHKYDWQRGHWAVPPHARAVWVAPRYEKHEQGYRYVPGQWQEEQQQKQREDEHRDRH
jgi:hypothetical protein